MTAQSVAHERLTELATLDVNSGNHSDFDDGHCAMELVSWLANEAFSDSPGCTCPVIASFVRKFNDNLPNDEARNRLLKPLLPRLIGTASTQPVREKRGYIAADYAVRVFVPIALEAHGLTEHAANLRACAPIVDKATALEGKKAAAAAAAAYAYAAYAYAADAAAAAAADAAYAYADAAAAYAADAAYAYAYAYADAAYAYAYAYADADADAEREDLYQLGVECVERMIEAR